jgi:hypothetical protein
VFGTRPHSVVRVIDLARGKSAAPFIRDLPRAARALALEQAHLHQIEASPSHAVLPTDDPTFALEPIVRRQLGLHQLADGLDYVRGVAGSAHAVKDLQNAKIVDLAVQQVARPHSIGAGLILLRFRLG